MNGKRAIAVDWDGTCVEQTWPEFSPWLPGAQEALRELADEYDVYIWSTRIVGREYLDWEKVLPQEEVDAQIAYIRSMLDEAGLEDVHIFESYPGHGIGKLSAIAYIDDKAIQFKGDWDQTLAELHGLLGV